MTLAEDAADHKSDVGGALAEAAHEIREPLPAEWNVNTHQVAVLHQRRLKVASDSIQHLKLESVGGDGALERIGADVFDHFLVVRGDRRILAGVEEHVCQPPE